MKLEIATKFIIGIVICLMMLVGASSLVWHYYKFASEPPGSTGKQTTKREFTKLNDELPLVNEEASHKTIAENKKDSRISEAGAWLDLTDEEYYQEVSTGPGFPEKEEAITIIKEKTPLIVKSFPEKISLSTPESAYAAINRIIAQGKDGQWKYVTLKRDQSLADYIAKSISKEEADMFLSATIIEVLYYGDSIAGVVAYLPSPSEPFDLRWLEREEGEWKNLGEDRINTLEEARNTFEYGISIQ